MLFLFFFLITSTIGTKVFSPFFSCVFLMTSTKTNVAPYMPTRSFEYIFFVSSSVLINLAGFIHFYRMGKRIDPIRRHHSLIAEPVFPFSYLGSVGLDVSDYQWRVFYQNLGLVTAVLLIFIGVGKIVRLFASRPTPLSRKPNETPSRSSEVPSEHLDELGLSDPCCSRDSIASNASSTYRLLDPNHPDEGPQNSSSSKSSVSHLVSLLFIAPAARTARPGPLLWFHAMTGICFLLVLGGPRGLFEIFLALINYTCIRPLYLKGAPFYVAMTVMWSFMVGTLFSNYYFDGYSFKYFGLSFLDDIHSIMPWTIHYNMTVLRMIAFNNDLWEATKDVERRRKEVYEKHLKYCVECALLRESLALKKRKAYEDTRNEEALSESALSPPYHGLVTSTSKREFLSCYKCRTECPRPRTQYHLLAYMAYLFYIPLFIAGPMISFNGYISYIIRPAHSLRGYKTALYGARMLGNLVFTIAFLHYFFVPFLLLREIDKEEAISAGFDLSSDIIVSPNSMVRVLNLLSLEEKCYLFYAALAFIWCKFNVIWKYFRFFSILDGIDCPEDMLRCFSNTVSITEFWQSWHASFNVWVVRYMYIPMGGSKYKLFSIVPIFVFIAIWHDIELRLLHWALFMCACFIPEVAIINFFQRTKWSPILKLRSNPVHWRHVKEFGAVIGEWALIMANLIGFSTGVSAVFGQVSSMGKISKTFLCFFLLFYLGTGKLSVRSREKDAHKLMETKQRLKMETPPKK